MYGRNVNQTAQRGTQGAYTGSEAMAGGAQVLLTVMSSDVSKGHSLKGSKFPLLEKEFSTGGKFIFHRWKDNFPLVEIRRVPNSRLTHNKKNKQNACLLCKGPINSYLFDNRVISVLTVQMRLPCANTNLGQQILCVYLCWPIIP